ncbi:MAG: selenocysteine-specific translation elongation factor [Myxococcota bacterium]|nr:selenocysteine-specific translation elongation factor [Myxococcota bacterium]
MKDQATSKRHIIVGTAGHIDHGKTSLVKALTGVDADTLAEEKRRGITIELGFVFMDTPDPNREILFIDVPGHEKLVKTMVAGAANIDAALFVVAADEGINLQTQEHFDILRILDIPRGVIAMTKADLVDTHRIADLTETMKIFVAGSFLENAPIVPVSAVTLQGIDDLKQALFEIGKGVRERRDTAVFRMPVDRVFTMQGFGTVVAGTVLSGSIQLGDEVDVYPERIKTKIRGIQVRREKNQGSAIGKRTALNLQNVEKSKLRRGQCVAIPGSLVPSYRMDGVFQLLQSAGDVKNLTRLRFYTGTSETICRVALLDRDRLKPGDAAPAQFILAEKIVAKPDDRFVIRSLSPMFTVGGGTILDATPEKHKRFDADMLEGLKRLGGDIEDRIEQIVYQSKNELIDQKKIILKSGRFEHNVADTLATLVDKQVIFEHPDKKAAGYLHKTFFDALKARQVDLVKTYLKEHPAKLEMPLNDLRSEMVKDIEPSTFQLLLSHLIADGILDRDGTNISLMGYRVPLTDGDEKIAEQVELFFINAGIESPREGGVCESLGVDPSRFKKIMASLVNRKKVLRLTPKVSYHCTTFADIKQKVLSLLEKKRSITIAEFRDELGLSRKYAQAILEYCDETAVTKRVGDQHVLYGGEYGKV